MRFFDGGKESEIFPKYRKLSDEEFAAKERDIARCFMLGPAAVAEMERYSLEAWMREKRPGIYKELAEAADKEEAELKAEERLLAMPRDELIAERDRRLALKREADGRFLSALKPFLPEDCREGIAFRNQSPFFTLVWKSETGKRSWVEVCSKRDVDSGRRAEVPEVWKWSLMDGAENKVSGRPAETDEKKFSELTDAERSRMDALRTCVDSALRKAFRRKAVREAYGKWRGETDELDEKFSDEFSGPLLRREHELRGKLSAETEKIWRSLLPAPLPDGWTADFSERHPELRHCCPGYEEWGGCGFFVRLLRIRDKEAEDGYRFEVCGTYRRYADADGLRMKDPKRKGRWMFDVPTPFSEIDAERMTEAEAKLFAQAKSFFSDKEKLAKACSKVRLLDRERAESLKREREYDPGAANVLYLDE